MFWSLFSIFSFSDNSLAKERDSYKFGDIQKDLLNITQSTYASTSKAKIIKKAKAGDVIQFKKKGEDRYTHAMWIYEKSGGTLKLSGHTNSRLNTILKRYQLIKNIELLA